MPRSSRREGEAAAEGTEERPVARNESVGLLNTIDESLDDMRAIITCRVCVQPLYEPFTIECGHTFCYVCLRSWLQKNAANRTCPDCRARITREPAPAYLIREMTQLFSNRAELLPAGETTKQHQDQQREEAKVLEEDRQGRGLFGGCFRHAGRRGVPFEDRIIIDDEDGVNRCPRCTWEVEDGECAGCGWPGEAESSDDGSVISLMSLDEIDRLVRAGDPHAAHAVGLLTASELDAMDDDSEDGESSENDSVGSLNEFVVQNEGRRGGQRPSRLTARQLELRFPRRRRSRETESAESTDASADPLFGRVSTIGSESEIDGDSRFDSSSAEDSDPDGLPISLESPSTGSRYVDHAGNLQYRRASDTIRANPTVVQISDDEDVIAPPLRARNRRPRPNRAHGGIGRRSPLLDILAVSSDSDGPVAPSRARRRRAITDSSPNTVRNSGSAIDRSPRTARIMMGGIDTDEDDAAVNNEDAGRNIPDERDDVHDPSLIEVGDSDDDPVTQSQSQETVTRSRLPQSRLDPTTSIPVRRENVNMPGAFPPSFVSEQGQSQTTPLINFQDLTTPPSARGSSSTRQKRPGSDLEPTFLDRRRHEERLYPLPGGESHRRDRSAAKSARRQDRQRVKAEQEARDRRNGEPSVPPSTTS